MYITFWAKIEIGQVPLSLVTLGNHTFAAVGTGESYEALSTAFVDVFKEINEMIQSPTILVNGVQYDLDIYLGGDYKVICKLCKPMHYILTHFQYFPPSSSC